MYLTPTEVFFFMKSQEGGKNSGIWVALNSPTFSSSPPPSSFPPHSQRTSRIEEEVGVLFSSFCWQQQQQQQQQHWRFTFTLSSSSSSSSFPAGHSPPPPLSHTAQVHNRVVIRGKEEGEEERERESGYRTSEAISQKKNCKKKPVL